MCSTSCPNFHLPVLASVDAHPSWERGIRYLLTHHGLYTTLSHRPRPGAGTVALQRYHHARRLILAHISTELLSALLPSVQTQASPRQLLEAIRELCQPAQVHAITALQHELENCLLKDFPSVDAYILEHRRIHSRLRAARDITDDDKISAVLPMISGLQGHETLHPFISRLYDNAPRTIPEVHAAINMLSQAATIGQQEQEWKMIAQTWSAGKMLMKPPTELEAESEPETEQPKQQKLGNASSPVTPAEGSTRSGAAAPGDTRRRGRAETELETLYKNMFRESGSSSAEEEEREKEKIRGVDGMNRKLLARMYADDIVEGLGSEDEEDKDDDDDDDDDNDGSESGGCACGGNHDVPQPLALAIGAMMQMAAHEHHHHHHGDGAEDRGVVEVEGEEEENDDGGCDCMLCSRRRS